MASPPIPAGRAPNEQTSRTIADLEGALSAAQAREADAGAKLRKAQAEVERGRRRIEELEQHLERESGQRFRAQMQAHDMKEERDQARRDLSSALLGAAHALDAMVRMPEPVVMEEVKP